MQTTSPAQQQPDDAWTFQRLHQWTRDYLAKKGSESAELETQLLMAHAFVCKKVEIFTRYAEVASEDGRARLRGLIEKRIDGCPVAYLVGQKEFYSLSFEVTPAVLIPRGDSEWIVEECLRAAKEMQAPAVLDVGTGSGNLAVAIAQQHKTARVTAVDVSHAALEIARRNADKHEVAERVEFLESDLFTAVPADRSFDFIVSNPPYVRRDELSSLQPEVRDFEPRSALDGGDDGFDFFDPIVDQARARLKPGGRLIIEIGADQEADGRHRIQAHSEYQLHDTVRDGGGRARVLVARYEP